MLPGSGSQRTDREEDLRRRTAGCPLSARRRPNTPFACACPYGAATSAGGPRNPGPPPLPLRSRDLRGRDGLPDDHRDCVPSEHTCTGAPERTHLPRTAGAGSGRCARPPHLHGTHVRCTLALALRASAVPVSEHSASGCPGGLPGLAAPRTSSRRVSGRALRPSKTQHLRSGQVSWCTSRAAAPRGRGDPAADRTSAEPTVAAYHTQCRCCPSGRVTRREAGLHARWYGILSPFTFG